MRATWPGARSGRISITTLPLVVSRIMVLSVLVIGCLSLEGSVVDETDGNRLAGDRPRHSRREVERRAARERRVDGIKIGIPRFRRNPGADISHARRRDDLAAAPE